MTCTNFSLVAAMDELLKAKTFNDYCPNGLQVAGRQQISKVVTAVTASLNAIEAAAELGADMLLVHHGYFWKGESEPLVGMKYRRIKALMDAEINLVAYHLPLDAHMELGNNASLAKLLGVEVDSYLSERDSTIGMRGHLANEVTTQGFVSLVGSKLERVPSLIDGGKPIKHLAWCTGAGQRFIEDAAAVGADTFISGEISEPTAHIARELGINYLAVGHHASERYGVQALGAWLAKNFCVEHQFFEDPNPA